MTAPQGEVANAGGGIALERLTKRYNGEPVVNGISAAIAPGEFFSFLGPSGSGKTTTLMLIAGFVAPDEGAIVVSGNDVIRLSPQQRGFGVVFQHYAIFPHLNVWDNIAFPLKVRRTPKAEIAKRVEWAMDLVRLGGFGLRFANQLSGGQQQRVALARAIVFHPKVVLMDEPLGALDRTLRYQMQAEIKDIQRRLGMTVVYVTHDQEEAMNMSDRLAIMKNGSIEQVGTPSAVYDRPTNSFVARFLGEANLIKGTTLATAQSVTTVRLADGTQLRGCAGAAPMTMGADVLLFVRPEKVSIRSGTEAHESSPNDNIVIARVRSISFLGNTIRYAVDAGRDCVITVDAPNVRTRPKMSVGDAATVSWPLADSLLLAP